MISMRPIISGSAGPFFTIFPPDCKYLIVDDRFDLLLFDLLFSESLNNVAMVTNFEAKSPNDLHSSYWYSKTDWNIKMTMKDLMALMVVLHRVKIW